MFFAPGAASPLPGQLNIIDVVPGDPGYSDFWRVHKVTVPAGYLPNTVTSLAEITARGFTVEPTTTLVNCPVVPEGSKASLRVGGGSAGLVKGWYKDQVVTYFSFEEAPLMGTTVPSSPIYVTFNVNPDQPGGGPASGFVTEPGGDQTHNVVATLPGDVGYSPLWLVNVYDNAAFSTVKDLPTAMAAPSKAEGVAKVNCPIVQVGGAANAAIPTEATALKSFLMDKRYMNWKAEAAAHPSTGPHGRVRTFVNDVLAASWAANTTVHPLGAASVKELYSGNDVIGWAVLVKTAMDQGARNYYWYEIINGGVVADGNDVPLCSNCHGGGEDYVLTPPF